MAKKFSIITVNSEEIFLKGYAEPSDLYKSEIFVEIVSDISSFNTVEVEINHCLLLDFPGENVDISVEELNDMLDIFDNLVEQEYIFSEEIITFEMQGLQVEDIVEETY